MILSKELGSETTRNGLRWYLNFYGRISVNDRDAIQVLLPLGSRATLSRLDKRGRGDLMIISAEKWAAIISEQRVITFFREKGDLIFPECLLTDVVASMVARGRR